MNYEIKPPEWSPVFYSDGAYRPGLSPEMVGILWSLFWTMAPIAIIAWIIL